MCRDHAFTKIPRHFYNGFVPRNSIVTTLLFGFALLSNFSEVESAVKCPSLIDAPKSLVEAALKAKAAKKFDVAMQCTRDAITKV